MIEFSTILAGFCDAFSLVNLAYVLLGVIIGQFVGAVPGIGPVMAMAIAVPFTFALDPLPAIAFLIGVNKGGLVGGAVPAVLMNTPGTPDAAATALDGYPLAKSGKPLKATKMALFSSVTGDTFSDIVLITVSAPLAVLALKMGPVSSRPYDFRFLSPCRSCWKFFGEGDHRCSFGSFVRVYRQRSGKLYTPLDIWNVGSVRWITSCFCCNRDARNF